MNRYPIYIISKGRAKNQLTSKALDRMGVNHYVIVEGDDYKEYYNNKTEHASILILPRSYIEVYDTCDDVKDMPKGSGPARNYCIDHSRWNGDHKHWLLDDNIEDFNRLNKNEKHVVRNVGIFEAAEDFTDRYINVPLSGLNYYSFAKTSDELPPFYLNTRIYSCMLIDNHSGFRWRARFNEDVDFSLRVLKSGQCTILFNAFLCGKVTTQKMKGGNTDTIYVDGTLEKSKMIERLHPDIAKVVWRFNRWHHHVDYSKFDQPLLLSEPSQLKGVNNYGMKLTKF